MNDKELMYNEMVALVCRYKLHQLLAARGWPTEAKAFVTTAVDSDVAIKAIEETPHEGVTVFIRGGMAHFCGRGRYEVRDMTRRR